MNTLILGWTNGWSKRAAAGRTLGLLAVVLAASPMVAQSAHRTRRESNASRKARVERTIAQTYGHKYEVAGGGGYVRFRSGQYLQQNNEVTFWMSGMYALNPELGVAGEVRGAYGNAKIGNTIYNIPNPQISEYSFLAGPSYRFRAKEKYSISGFAEGGVGLGKFAGASKGLSAADIGVWTGDYAGAFSVGAHVDYNIYPNLALRVTPNYLGTFYGGTFQHSKGLDAGVMYRFGRK